MEPGHDPSRSLSHLERPLRLTRAGMVAERLTRCFWKVWTLLFAVVAVLMFGLQETAPLELAWFGGVGVLAALGWFLYDGIRRFRWPSRAEAMARLDATLPGRPLQALADAQAIGADDPQSAAVWAAHLRRMAARAEGAEPVAPDLRLARRDPYALRYVALVALVMAALFGSFLRLAEVPGAVTPGGGDLAAGAPSWEGWIEPPAYTGKPTLYLNDLAAGRLEIPEGSRISLRLYGEVGALSVDETVSGRSGDAVGPATDPAQEFDVTRNGRLVIHGPGGREWQVELADDHAPRIAPEGAMEREPNGRMTQVFRASDDHGVVAGQAVISLDLGAIARRYGLAVDPDPREPITVDLPMPISGNRADFSEALVEDFSKHPWVGLPVTMVLTAEDALGQQGRSAPVAMILPGRRFFDPLAAAIIEQRRDLMWARANGARVAQVLRALTWKPEEVLRDVSAYLPLRVATRRLEAGVAAPGGLDPAVQDEVAEALWAIALQIEQGDLSDALARLHRAQDRLAEAARNGATDEEIAQLMDELRQALQDYMRQLAEQQDPNAQQQLSENAQTMTGDQLQQLLDRLQQLMEEGRTAEAMALLQQLMQMMENMQVVQGQGGQGGQGPGQQAMEDLAQTLRDQQELSDDAFDDLQDQYDPGRGQQQGQQGEGQQGQNNGAEGDRDGAGRSPGELADRQGALGQRLGALERGLPGAGSKPGEEARRSLGEAGRAMDRAEQALRDDDLAGAIDEQSRAMEAMREGMRSLGEAMAQDQQRGQGTEGRQTGDAGNPNGRDPLGRQSGNRGNLGTNEQLLQGDDVYRRARDLLDEIRRRSGERERPEQELDYLRRLLDRF